MFIHVLHAKLFSHISAHSVLSLPQKNNTYITDYGENQLILAI